MKARFVPQTDIARCCDQSATRYALNGVLVSPAPDGKHVWLSACDGRTLAATKVEGEAVEPTLAPAKAVAAKGAKRGPQAVYRENGHWVDRKQTMHEPIEGRFPNAAEVLPDFDLDPMPPILLSINSKLLANLAAALNDGAEHVTLLISPDPESRIVKTAIGVLGSHGIGVLMPFAVAGNHESDEGARFRVDSQWKDQRREYRAEFANVTSSA